MNKIMPNGTEVLIFRNFHSLYYNQENEIFIVGVILCSRESEDLSYHGSPYYEQIYEVLGQDGKKYIGTYQSCLIGNYIFRTKEDHIERLKNIINKNNKEILKIKNKNIELNNQIELLINSNHELDNQKIKAKTSK